MLSSRWQVFQPVWNQMQTFQNEMNRLLDGAQGAGESFGFPLLNVWEEGEQLQIEAELPGLALNDLEIFVTGGNTLTIQGERKPFEPENGTWHRQERGYGRFVRSLKLPYAVDADTVDAKLENGVLNLTLTKHESAKPRLIAVKG